MAWAISSRTSSQMPSLRGAAKTPSCSALSPSTSTICSTPPSGLACTRTSTPSIAGISRLPRSSRSTPSGAYAASHGPRVGGAGSSSAARLRSSAADGGASVGRTCFGPPRLRENITATFRNQGLVPAGGAGATGAPDGVVEGVDHLEHGSLHPLDDQLGDAVAARDLDGPFPVVVDQEDQNLAAVAGVDRTGRVEHRHTQPGG